MVRIENHSDTLEITCYVAILCVFMLFWTFAHKVAKTLIVLYETLNTTLFCMYYFFEVARIKYHSDMLEITC